MKPLRLLLLAVLASAAAADPPPRTPEDDLRDAMAHEPIDVKFERPLVEVAAFLQETLQVNLLIDPKADARQKAIQVSGEKLRPEEILRRVREAAGLVEVNFSGLLLWTTEARAAEFAKRRKPALSGRPTELDRANLKELQEHRLDLDFTDSRPEDLVDFLQEFLKIRIVLHLGRESAFSFAERNATALEVLDVLAFYWGAEVTVADGSVTIEVPNWVQPPEEMKAKFENGSLRLDWNGPADGEYVVRQITDAGEKEVSKTREHFAVIEGLPVFRDITFSVTRVTGDGLASVPLEAKIGTWPPEYVRGKWMLPGWFTLAFDFTSQQSVWDKDSGFTGPYDFSLDLAQWEDGADGITLAAARGAADGIPGAFGAFDRAEARAFRHSAPPASVNLALPARGPLLFRLITRDGGYAHVRIEKHDNTGWMTFVYLPPLKLPEIATVIRELAALAPAIDPAESARLADAGGRLGDPDATVRDAARKLLREAGLKAVHVLSRIATEGDDAEAKARATETLQEIWLEEN